MTSTVVVVEASKPRIVIKTGHTPSCLPDEIDSVIESWEKAGVTLDVRELVLVARKGCEHMYIAAAHNRGHAVRVMYS